MSAGQVEVEFVMDDVYHRELHTEWTAAVGSGWRIDRVMICITAVLALALGAGAWTLGRPPLLALAIALGCVALFEAWKRKRRRRIWLDFCRTLPWFGKKMRIVLRGDELVQDNDYPGDPRFERTEAMLATPNGYLVRYRAVAAVEVPNAAISDASASVYIPHRAIRPPMSREDFTGRVAALRRL